MTEGIAQLQLPDPAGADPHPRLLLEGRGIHAGEGFNMCNLFCVFKLYTLYLIRNVLSTAKRCHSVTMAPLYLSCLHYFYYIL